MLGIIKKENIQSILPDLKPGEWIVTEKDVQFWIDGIIEEMFPELDHKDWTFAFCEHCEHKAPHKKVSHLLRLEYLAHGGSRVVGSFADEARQRLNQFETLLRSSRG